MNYVQQICKKKENDLFFALKNMIKISNMKTVFNRANFMLFEIIVEKDQVQASSTIGFSLLACVLSINEKQKKTSTDFFLDRTITYMLDI